jgi:hypothetical protein
MEYCQDPRQSSRLRMHAYYQCMISVYPHQEAKEKGGRYRRVDLNSRMSLADLPYSVAGLPHSQPQICPSHDTPQTSTNLVPTYSRPPTCRITIVNSSRASSIRYDCASQFLGESDTLGAGCGTVHPADAGFPVHSLTPNLLPTPQPECEHLRVSSLLHRMTSSKRILA